MIVLVCGFSSYRPWPATKHDLFLACQNSALLSLKLSAATTIDMTGEYASESPKRVYPPPYKSSGSVSSDRLAFIHILERLKVSTSISIVEAVGHLCCRHKSGRDGSIIKCIVSFKIC